MKTKINKIIIAAAVLFAAGLSNISAIAQESVMTPATAEVYQRPTYIRPAGANNINFGDSVIVIVEGIGILGGGDYSFVGSLLNRINDDDPEGGSDINTTMLLDGLLLYGPIGQQRKMAPGDRFQIIRTDSTRITAYMYTATDNQFYFAENTGNTAATADMGEFFLDAEFNEIAEPAAGSQGFVRAECNSGYQLQPDMTSCLIFATCGENAINDPADGTMCVCENTETHQFVDGSTTTCKPIVILTEDDCENTQYLDENENICKDRTAENCENTQVFSPANGGGGFCQTPAIYLAANSTLISPTYTAASCERAGWIPSITINSGNTAAAELCGIPVVRDDSALMSAAIASGRVGAEFAPLQFNEDDPVGGCIIRESSGFADLPNCNDPQLFGDGGFPQMPEDFDVARDRLTVVFIADGNNRYFADGGEVFVRRTGGDGESDAKDLAHIGAGIFLVGAIAVFLSSGEVPDFNFTPEFGYSATESGYAANIGGRADFRKDKWHLYYLANQTNANGEFGDFRYTSGGKYTADLWTATFSESVAGETADYDLSLSANLQNEVWKISPVYRLHSEYEKGETETRNELNLQGDFRYNKWTIRPTAGFQWRSFGGFAENARFQINAVHRF